jgi:hypothetical protein
VRPAGILSADENFPTSREALPPIRAMNLEQKTTKTAKIICGPLNTRNNRKFRVPFFRFRVFRVFSGQTFGCGEPLLRFKRYWDRHCGGAMAFDAQPKGSTTKVLFA